MDRKLLRLAARAQSRGCDVHVSRFGHLIISMNLINPFKKHPNFVYDQNSSDTIFFRNLLLLGFPQFEKQVIDFYLDYEERIPEKQVTSANLCKIGEIYYAPGMGQNMMNSSRSIMIDIDEWRELDLVEARRIAIRSLLSVIDEPDLSLAEQRLVASIAIEALDHSLEIAAAPVVGTKNVHSFLISRMRFNEAAINQLQSYGFKIKQSNGYLDIELRR